MHVQHDCACNRNGVMTVIQCMQAANQLASMLPPAFQPMVHEAAATMRKFGADGEGTQAEASATAVDRARRAQSQDRNKRSTRGGGGKAGARGKHGLALPAVAENALQLGSGSGRSGAHASRALQQGAAAAAAAGGDAGGGGGGGGGGGDANDGNLLSKVADGGESLLQRLPEKHRESQVRTVMA